jgi:hypothetical protein
VRGWWPFEQRGRQQRAFARGQPDGGNDEPTDADDAVAPERPPGDIRGLAQQVLGLLARDAAELQVDRGVPVLPVMARGVHQVEQVRAKRERGGNREHRQHCAGQCAAHRHGGAPLPGFQGKTRSGRHGHRRG